MARLAQPVRILAEPQSRKRARIALVQIAYNPAYRYKVDYLSEPLGVNTPGGAYISTLRLNDHSIQQQITTEAARTRESYIKTHMARIRQVLDWLKTRQVDLVCFPEYAIPAEMVAELIRYASEFSLVLPSHTATESTLELLGRAYHTTTLPFTPGQALYVAVARAPDPEVYIAAKVTRSQFEPSLRPGDATAHIPLLGPADPVAVAMCSDFLQGRGTDSLSAGTNPLLGLLNSASLRVVSSFTPSTDPFFDIASQDLVRGLAAQRRPTAFVNASFKGGTSLFGLMATEQFLDPHDDYCSYRLPEHSEAVVIFDVALGPQLELKRSPLNPEDRSQLVAMVVLVEDSSIWKAATGALLEEATKASHANEMLLGNIKRSKELLDGIVPGDGASGFGQLSISTDASLTGWRVNTARRWRDLLKALVPSIDSVDRQQVELRLKWLEAQVAESAVVQVGSTRTTTGTEPAKVQITAQTEQEFFEIGRNDARHLVAAYRLTKTSRNAPLEDTIGPTWALLSTVSRDTGLTLEVRYDVLRGQDVGVSAALTDLTIEVFVIAHYDVTSDEQLDRARAGLFDIGRLLQTGYGDRFRFSPVSEALWKRFTQSQQFTFRLRAAHRLVERDGKTFIVPYRGHPKLAKVLRFLFSRGKTARVSLLISSPPASGPSYAEDADQVPPVPTLQQKRESGLDEALEDLTLMSLLRTPTELHTEKPFCKMQVSVELADEPSELVPQVIFRELLGSDFTFIDEILRDGTWRIHRGTSKQADWGSAEVASLRESLMLLRFPTGNLPSFGDRTSTSVLQVPIEVAEVREGCLVGHAFHPDAPKSLPIRMSMDDRRKHVYVVGKTGTGKTQFLLNMIMQDIESGQGVCVMDPHGDLYDDILSRFPRRRFRDLVLFDPTDHENPPGLNLFEHDRRNWMHRDFVLDEAVSIFLRLHGKEIFGPRIQSYFRNGATALMSDPSRERTLLDLGRLFLDDGFFNYIMNAAMDPAVVDFLAEFKRTADREKAEMLPYFQSKFTAFVSNAGIRNVIGQPRSTLNFREAMDRGNVVLVNLSKGMLGELNSRLLGMVLVSKVTWAALSGARLPPEQRRDFFLYCDEFQSFATEAFSTILSEARKYGLCLTLANQFLGQLRSIDNYVSGEPQGLREAVLGNVANIVAFRVGAKDAQDLAAEIAPDTGVRDPVVRLLTTQSRFTAVAKLDCGGLSTVPFSLESRMTDTQADPRVRDLLRKYFACENLHSRAFVLSEIQAARTDHLRE